MNTLAPEDGELIALAIARLVRNGDEANRLRALLLMALIDVAHLAGDKDEAAQLAAQLDRRAAEWRR